MLTFSHTGILSTTTTSHFSFPACFPLFFPSLLWFGIAWAGITTPSFLLHRPLFQFSVLVPWSHCLTIPVPATCLFRPAGRGCRTGAVQH